MSSNLQRSVEEDRAAELLGLSASELRRLSMETGFGHAKSGDASEPRVFTYAELYRLCRVAAQVAG